jgi:anti-anti-sigma regulatory factor
MTNIETQTAEYATTIRVQGELADDQIGNLERCWRRNRGGDIPLHLDLSEVEYIDEAAKVLVSRMFADGVELIVRSRPRG